MMRPSRGWLMGRCWVLGRAGCCLLGSMGSLRGKQHVEGQALGVQGIHLQAVRGCAAVGRSRVCTTCAAIHTASIHMHKLHHHGWRRLLGNMAARAQAFGAHSPRPHGTGG